MRFTPAILAALLLLLCPAVASAATVKTEAESIPAPAACWATTTWTALSGGAGRYCGYSANAQLRWSVSSNGTAVVRLYGYRDSMARGYRVRVDGGPWTTGTLSGASAPAALFYTSPALASGSHTFELEWTSGGAFTLDYYTVEQGDAPPAEALCNIDPGDGQDAIATAITRCPDGTSTTPTVVNFPAGRTYRLTGTIAVHGRNDLVIDGNGSTFLKTDSNVAGEREPLWRVLEGSRVIVRDMTIDGGEPFGPLAVPPGNQWNHGVAVFGGTGHTVRDATIRNIFGDAVTVAPSGSYLYNDVTRGQIARDVLIQRVQAYNTVRMCLGLTGGIGIRAEDNTLTHCRYAAIDLEIDYPGEKLQNVKVLRNRILPAVGNSFATYVSAIVAAGEPSLGAAPDDIQNIEIRDNNVLKPPATCFPTIMTSDKQTNRGPITNVAITGNTIQTQSDGISVNDTNTGSVSGNEITLTISPRTCESPAVPVRVLRSTGVTVGSNPATGY